MGEFLYTTEGPGSRLSGLKNNTTNPTEEVTRTSLESSEVLLILFVVYPRV